MRQHFLDRELLKQLYGDQMRNRVEFLRIQDNDWRSTGKKEQLLIEMSRGEYVMRMDDDDILHPQAIPLILEHCNGRNDVITYDVAIRPDTTGDCLCKISPEFYQDRPLDHAYWNDDNTVQYRAWHHLMPTRRDLYDGLDWDKADISLGEDNELIMQLFPKIKTWKYLNRTLYYAFPRHHNLDRKKRSPRYE